MTDTHSGAWLRSTISNLSHSDGSGLVSVPVETIDRAMADRVLQIQVFELTDHVVRLTDEVAQLTQQVQQFLNRRR